MALRHAVGFAGYFAANLQYGLLARQLREALALPSTGTELDALVAFVRPRTQSNAHYQFVMRDEVAKALETLG